MSAEAATNSLRLLDTNTVFELMRHPGGKVAARLRRLAQEQPDGRVCTSAVVDCELRFGVNRKGSARLADAYTRAMSVIEVRDLPAAVAPIYADIRTQLEQVGKPIGPNDLLIAAHALALDATLVTHNESEFRRVPGLVVENWLESAHEHE
ncbi:MULTISPECIES: PIN domain-containing protein [unclassified Variovorax]|jgi:tRNA(fMet)-specific endonuclease VapC|uniref:PIN domain-containing protein n=1 Tax=unclassified Variovorax TaxID=663243 RepID=UPI00076DDDD2|nr:MULTISPECIES: PIN domain-containing protein [unclassified Variovorax]KWT85170.1 VapC toxin protein [Variovorax sp. WDL1]PNG56604.1 Ribonuclease VapC2 [Variovorax sp. B4]PNG58028.1 Ribonuclease VapC2 [Variovorax sp. B2]VTV09493.1 Ribonuclease VapC1 [Variovorax sp. WDL1]